MTCKDDDGDNALHWAARNGHDTIVKILVDQGLDVNSRGEFDRTPLMLAAIEGHKRTFNILIRAGADSMCKDDQGNNALDLLTSDDDDSSDSSF